jgi:hypothetical protein
MEGRPETGGRETGGGSGTNFGKAPGWVDDETGEKEKGEPDQYADSVSLFPFFLFSR